jgi:NDP-sugar pyrophosphorylase family protein
MQVVVLVAGKSERFWPLSSKSLFPICGQSPLEEQLRQLRAAGLTDILVVAGPHNIAETKALVPQLPVILQEDMSLGTRGALLSALPHVTSERVLIVSGNDLVEPLAFQQVQEMAKQPGVEGVYLAKVLESYFPGGYVQLLDGRVAGIVEKPKPGMEPSDIVHIVVDLHPTQALLTALRDVPDDAVDGYSAAEQLLCQRHHYTVARYQGEWRALKYPWDLLHVLPRLLKQVETSHIHPTAQLHPTATIEGPVVLAEGVVIGPYSFLQGPLTIGAHTHIGPHATVRESSIGPACQLKDSSIVEHSIIGRGVCTVQASVRHSVIDDAVDLGSGFEVGHLRLDRADVHSVVKGQPITTQRQCFGTAIGRHCKVGIHVGVNPGMKIGEGSLISPHCLIEKDVPNDTYVHVENGILEHRQNRQRA